MMSVGLSEQDVQPYLETVKARTVVIACINGPFNVTLSGDASSISNLEKQFKANNTFARQLKVDVAYHSHHMRVIADDYLDSIKDIQTLPTESAVGFYSSVTGTRVALSELKASYWVRNMVSPVQFLKAFDALMPAQGGATDPKRDGLSVNTFLEVGPHSALQGPVKQILNKDTRLADTVYASVLHRGKDAITTSLEAMGTLWTKGQALDLVRVNCLEARGEILQAMIDLPKYPWK